nr:MAG TPA: hypothetical protein [Caudoviricetes sp.]
MKFVKSDDKKETYPEGQGIVLSVSHVTTP